MSLADPGGAAGMHPPNRINFFHFCIRFHEKVYVSEVGTPQRVGAPPTGNPGSATGCHMVQKEKVFVLCAVTAWRKKVQIYKTRALLFIAVCTYRFVMIRLVYYGAYCYCFCETSLVKHVPEYDVMVLRCYVTYRSCISYAIIYFRLYLAYASRGNRYTQLSELLLNSSMILV